MNAKIATNVVYPDASEDIWVGVMVKGNAFFNVMMHVSFAWFSTVSGYMLIVPVKVLKLLV